MDRVSVPASALVALALAGCQPAPPRIFTDRELADLEAKVLARVGQTHDCSVPEQLELTHLDPACVELMMKRPTRIARDVELADPAIQNIDAKCGARVLSNALQAVGPTPRCSPFQVGVRVMPERDVLQILHAAHLLAWHAQLEPDHYVGLTELLVGIRAFQDLGRGQVSLLAFMMPEGGEGLLIAAARDLLPLAALTPDKIDDLASQVDAVIATKPRYGEMLHADALFDALHYGVAALHPADWQPPGGRGDTTLSNTPRVIEGSQGLGDGAAIVMSTQLALDDLYASACPPTASVAECRRGLIHLVPERTRDEDLGDELVVRLRLFPGDDTRHWAQHQLLDLTMRGHGLDGQFMGEYVRNLTALVALRLRLQVLRDGHCPTTEELDAPPYSTLRAPAVLGDSVLVRVSDGALQVDPPTWVKSLKPRHNEPFTIPCP